MKKWLFLWVVLILGCFDDRPNLRPLRPAGIRALRFYASSPTGVVNKGASHDLAHPTVPASAGLEIEMIRFMTNIIPPPHNSLSIPDYWRFWRKQLDSIIGSPMETPFCTAEQLKAQGYVGIYIECTPQEAVRLVNMSIDSYRGIPVLRLSEPDKESCILHDAHRICRAFGEILSAGHPLVIETIDGRQYAVSAPPVLEGNSVLIFGVYPIEIAKIRSVQLEVPHA